MFEPGSRYEGIATAHVVVTGPDGEELPLSYVRRRFVPPPGDGSAVASHRVVAGDRLDLIAARHLGEPTLFWRICDANGAHRPDELVDEPGRVIDIRAEGV